MPIVRFTNLADRIHGRARKPPCFAIAAGRCRDASRGACFPLRGESVVRLGIGAALREVKANARGGGAR